MAQADIDEQMRAARRHSVERENLVGAALGVPGYKGMRYLMKSWMADGGVEDHRQFRENYGNLDWEMPCQECKIPSRTELVNGNLLCPKCSAKARQS